MHIKSSPSLLFGVLCLPGDQSHPFAQTKINPLACCICWAGLLGHAVFPPWNEGPNFGSYTGGLFTSRARTRSNVISSKKPFLTPLKDKVTFFSEFLQQYLYLSNYTNQYDIFTSKMGPEAFCHCRSERGLRSPAVWVQILTLEFFSCVGLGNLNILRFSFPISKNEILIVTN